MGYTILIADDDRQLVDLLVELLSEEGYQVRCAFDGQMALEALDRVPTDLVVADIAMPNLDGVALAKRLRAREVPVPVVLITARQIRIDDPAIPLLRKPFDLAEFVGVVGRALADRPPAAGP